MITYCGCTGNRGNSQAADYQNRRYGLGMRVFNSAEHGIRCTVCGELKLKRATVEKRTEVAR